MRALISPFARRLGAALVLGATLALPAAAQVGAGRPVTIVVPFPAGAGPDLAARTLGEKLSARLQRPVIVDNKPGAGGRAGAMAVARAKADGSTLLLAPNTLAIAPHVLPKAAGSGIDVLKDLAPIVTVATTPMLLVASPQAGIRSVEQLLAAGRKRDLAFGSAGNGSPMHFAGVMLARATGIKLMHVPYRGVAPSVVAAMSGEVPLLFVALGGVSSQLKAGKLVPVAVAEQQRSSLLANVPTFSEGGVKGVEVHAWYGLFTPTGTPDATVSELNRLVNEVLKLPDVRARFEGAGLELAGGSAQALAGAVAADYEKYGRIARELHIRAD